MADLIEAEDIVTRREQIAGTELLNGLTSIVSHAADAIRSAQQHDLGLREKADRSPVTAADQASEAVILDGLARRWPGVPVVSEEATGRQRPAGLGTRFFMVDPLDGTREFISGRDEFTINIALVDDGIPVAGVVAAPARGLVWRGGAGSGAERLAMPPGIGAVSERIAIHTRARPAAGLGALISRSHLDDATAEYLNRRAVAERIACGSALKFCLVAEGAADLYPRLAPTSEWDVAAGHALLLAAGGDVVGPNGEPLRYGQSEDFIVPAFIAFGDRDAPPPL